MNIGILGSGIVAQTIGTKLIDGRHSVMLGTRDVTKLQAWRSETGGVGQAGSFADAAAHGEILINATAGTGSLAALHAAGADHLHGKLLIDVANPLDFSHGIPPSLSVANTDSLAEQIQRAFPDVRVVKALNTINIQLLVNPQQLAGGDHHAFVSGNDAEAKAQVATLLDDWFGWTQIIDLGDISSARGSEMLLPLCLHLWGALGTPLFNVKIVR